MEDMKDFIKPEINELTRLSQQKVTVWLPKFSKKTRQVPKVSCWMCRGWTSNVGANIFYFVP